VTLIDVEPPEPVMPPPPTHNQPMGQRRSSVATNQARHPKRSQGIKPQPQTDARPPDWPPNKHVENPVIDHRHRDGKNHWGDDKYNR
jgi:hypothetical protein